jgi:hypothetical protein
MRISGGTKRTMLVAGAQRARVLQSPSHAPPPSGTKIYGLSRRASEAMFAVSFDQMRGLKLMPKNLRAP